MSQTPPEDQPKPEPTEDFSFPSLHEEGAPEAPLEEADAPTDDSADAPPSGGREPGGSWLARNRTLVLLLATVVIGGLMYGTRRFLDRAGGPDPIVVPAGIDEIPVNVVEARLGRFQDVITTVGTLKGETEIELRFQVDGRIDEFGLFNGARVQRGQLIARLYDRDARLKVQRARLELEQLEKLFQLGGVSRTKLDEARLSVEIAQADLDKTRIVATRDAIFGDKEADIGEFVTPQRRIGKLVSIGQVIVNVGIIDKQVDKVFPGQKIIATVDAYPGSVFEGLIESISPLIGGQSNTAEVTARIPNPDSLLLPGMFVRARIITYEADDAISIPNESLIKTPGGFQVFVIDAEGIAHARDVEVGYVAVDSAEIDAGLNPGETVVVQKPPELKSGSKVKIIDVQR